MHGRGGPGTSVTDWAIGDGTAEPHCLHPDPCTPARRSDDPNSRLDRLSSPHLQAWVRGTFVAFMQPTGESFVVARDDEALAGAYIPGTGKSLARDRKLFEASRPAVLKRSERGPDYQTSSPRPG
jgi:hypothetical protein